MRPSAGTKSAIAVQFGIFFTSDAGRRSNWGMQARFAVAVLGLGGIFCFFPGTSHPNAATFPKDDKTIVHVLNRLSFGPRPGDVDRVRQLGVERYIEQQLHPEHMADSGLQARLAGLETIGLSSRAIAEQYERPVLEARREKQQRMKGDAGGGEEPPKQPDPQQQRANKVVLELAEQKILRAVYSDRQLQEVLTDFWFNHFNVDARKGVDRFLLTEYERDAIRPHVLGKFRDLLEADGEEPGDVVLSGQLDERRSERRASANAAGAHCAQPFRRADVHPSFAAPRGAGKERAEGSQRELWPRADGAAHARRRRRLHAEGRHRSRARVHGLDDSAAAARRLLQVRAASARRWRENRPWTPHQGRRRDARRRAGARHPRDASIHGALHRGEAGAPLRQRHASAGARRSRRRPLHARPAAICGKRCGRSSRRASSCRRMPTARK